MKRRVLAVFAMLMIFGGGCSVLSPEPSAQWTAGQADAWYEENSGEPAVNIAIPSMFFYVAIRLKVTFKALEHL